MPNVLKQKSTNATANDVKNETYKKTVKNGSFFPDFFSCVGSIFFPE
jgi:hypothetical protein